ncbi:hypothetical protein AMAG_20568 [Allomyces macrogynus ATCC 38327]|uniref:Uncharacterized protein n=1 Tax=Allomyces macrogynus (strain ATCC 38327) TaxID=578462 RepID=A0A0L0TC92_ALLM3|nr:hypothetical protein AMAG_20568 [Allomyces macrogynus ATCC 38327]|eukprot:KNE72362.1 hypothetical protein AMAG_20568 [Allomyces macrogynus ATCC 38327]
MHEVSSGTLETLVMAYVHAGGVQRLLDTVHIYGALVASNMVTKLICAMVAGPLADAVGRADAPVGERWGHDRVAAIRMVMDDAVEFGVLSSQYADIFLYGALIRAMTWQHAHPLLHMVKAMADQGANIDMRALSSLTTKLMDAVDAALTGIKSGLGDGGVCFGFDRGEYTCSVVCFALEPLPSA